MRSLLSPINITGEKNIITILKNFGQNAFNYPFINLLFINEPNIKF